MISDAVGLVYTVDGSRFIHHRSPSVVSPRKLLLSLPAVAGEGFRSSALRPSRASLKSA
jgi:hypothetical protein